MFTIFTYIILFLHFHTSSSETVEIFDPKNDLPYCQIKCRGHPHVGCTCNKGLAPECFPWEPDNMDDFRYSILRTHNILRNKIASGYDESEVVGAASDMNVLNYDFGLEYMAYCTGIRCKETRTKCQKTKNFPYTNQNIYTLRPVDHDVDFGQVGEKAARVWYNFLKGIENRNLVDNYEPDATSKYFKFTIMIWAELTHIGCAATAKNSITRHKKFDLYIVCNYGSNISMPNTPNRPVYKRTPYGKKPGHLCSIRHSHYTALCGNSTEIPKGNGLPAVLSKCQYLKYNFLFIIISVIMHIPL